MPQQNQAEGKVKHRKKVFSVTLVAAEHRLPKTKLLKPSKTATCGRAANLVWAGLRVLSVPVPGEPGLI
jgi:hypothetical protein